MRVFCSIAQTGENDEEVAQRMERVRHVFEVLGIPMYSILYDEQRQDSMEPRELMRLALERLRQYDTLFVINTSPRRSEGMLMEIGAALERDMTLVYAQHVSSIDATYVPTLADRHFTWSNEDELIQKTQEVFGPMNNLAQ